jgi:hypothetical protein
MTDRHVEAGDWAIFVVGVRCGSTDGRPASQTFTGEQDHAVDGQQHREQCPQLVFQEQAGDCCWR